MEAKKTEINFKCKPNALDICREYEIKTPEFAKQYKKLFKEKLKINRHRGKTLFMMRKIAKKWYQDEDINLSLEKIHIKTKLGSYESGGCGIEASVLASFTASGILTYAEAVLKKFIPFSIILYAVVVILCGAKIMTREDDMVEMYYLFLDVIEEIEENK